MSRPTSSSVTEMSRSTNGPKREQGQIIVLFVFALVLIMGAAALVIDVGVLRNANQNLWNALDAGALAGASQLPADAANADAIALQYADLNYPGGLPSTVTVGFRCVIGSVGGVPRGSDIPAVCDPGPNAAWTCNATICQSVCLPDEGDICNTIVLESAVPVDYRFGRAIGIDSGTTQTVLSAACKGPCGAKPSEPVDLMLVVDRTSSMNGVDTDNARSAADAVRRGYNPAEQWMGMGMLGPSAATSCDTNPDSTIGTANFPGDLDRWVPVGLSGIGAPVNESYTSSGSKLAQAISCFTNSSTGTDLSDPVTAAAYELNNFGRPGVTKGILLMTDGQPNNSTTSGPNYCAQSAAAATAAKNQGIVIFTIGFGLDGGNNILCPDTSGPYAGLRATRLLADMASNNSADDNGCPGTENDDLDNFFCLPKSAGASTNLAELFKQAANTLVGGTKLIQLP
jgi:putative Flp pilus-assembly TadE/G-like protein/von Willebrand factor type A domain-containing protein